MPIFRDLTDVDAEIVREENENRKPGLAHLDDVERELIIRWLTDQAQVVFGGDPIAAPPAPARSSAARSQ